jgi:hypothetical protein
MNTQNRKCSPCLAAVGIAGSFLVMGWMVWLMRSYTAPQPLAEIRAGERLKIKQAFDEVNAPLVSTYDWQDKAHGFIRIPVETAKDLILQEWQDPAKGKKVLTDRATTEFAPVAEKKSVYE